LFQAAVAMMPHVNINILDRPLIDWDLKLIMEPPTLFGALIGANLNRVFSETILAIMLVILPVSQPTAPSQNQSLCVEQKR
jgi:uncharacterized membrane protein YfcA